MTPNELLILIALIVVVLAPNICEIINLAVTDDDR